MNLLSQIICDNCKHENERNRATCDKCDEKIGSGYPNVNVYSDDYFKKGLEELYQKTIKNYTSEEVQRKIIPFENHLKNDSRIVLNMDKKLFFELFSKEEDYLPYRRAVEQGKRLYAKIFNDYRRTVVDASFYGSHGADIVFASLTMDENGLKSYGDISITLNTSLVKKRVTVFEKNSFDLYDELTKDSEWNPAHFPPPSGHYSIWENRHQLAVIKCHDKISGEENLVKFCEILLQSDGNRNKDEFIEVHLYNKINYHSFDKVKLQVNLTDKKHRIDWEIVKEKLEKTSIEVIVK